MAANKSGKDRPTHASHKDTSHAKWSKGGDAPIAQFPWPESRGTAIMALRIREAWAGCLALSTTHRELGDFRAALSQACEGFRSDDDNRPDCNAKQDIAVYPPTYSEIDDAAAHRSMKTGSKIHRARSLMFLSAHDPTQYQKRGITSSTGRAVTHTGSPGRRYSRGQASKPPARSAGMFRIIANLRGHGQT